MCVCVCVFLCLCYFYGQAPEIALHQSPGILLDAFTCKLAVALRGNKELDALIVTELTTQSIKQHFHRRLLLFEVLRNSSSRGARQSAGTQGRCCHLYLSDFSIPLNVYSLTLFSFPSTFPQDLEEAIHIIALSF